MTDDRTPAAPDLEPDASAPEPPRRPATRRRILGVVGVGAALVALPQAGRLLDRPSGPGPAGGAGAGDDVSGRFAAFLPADEPNGDPAMVVWPDFVLDGPAEVRRLYEFQVVNGDLMRWMPCFCGCNREDGHRNNRDCYIEAVNPDGSVVFDAMAPT